MKIRQYNGQIKQIESVRSHRGDRASVDADMLSCHAARPLRDADSPPHHIGLSLGDVNALSHHRELLLRDIGLPLRRVELESCHADQSSYHATLFSPHFSRLWNRFGRASYHRCPQWSRNRPESFRLHIISICTFRNSRSIININRCCPGYRTTAQSLNNLSPGVIFYFLTF